MGAWLRSFVLCSLLVGCGLGASDPGDEVARLNKRVTNLEKRLQKLEARAGRAKAGHPRGAKAKGGKAKARPRPPAAGPAAPTREVALDGVTAAILATPTQRFKLPGRVPPGRYTLMTAFFDDEPLARHGEIVVPPGTQPALLACVGVDEPCVLTVQAPR